MKVPESALAEPPMASTEDLGPPTEYELAMALRWTIVNGIRLFFNVPPDDILPGEAKFLEAWRAIPLERRQAALDHPVEVPDHDEAEKMRAVLAMRRRVL